MFGVLSNKKGEFEMAIITATIRVTCSNCGGCIQVLENEGTEDATWIDCDCGDGLQNLDVELDDGQQDPD